MQFLTFDRGSWGEVDMAIPDTGDPDADYARMGFHTWTDVGKYTRWGHGFGSLYHVGEPDAGHGWTYLLDLEVGVEFHVGAILVKDLPSLLELIRLAEPLWRLDHEAYRTETLEMIIRKVFEAWHGHSVDDICRECARREHDRAEERRWELRKTST
jgi:hypothetical protein